MNHILNFCPKIRFHLCFENLKIFSLIDNFQGVNKNLTKKLNSSFLSIQFLNYGQKFIEKIRFQFFVSKNQNIELLANLKIWKNKFFFFIFLNIFKRFKIFSISKTTIFFNIINIFQQI